MCLNKWISQLNCSYKICWLCILPQFDKIDPSWQFLGPHIHNPHNIINHDSLFLRIGNIRPWLFHIVNMKFRIDPYFNLILAIYSNHRILNWNHTYRMIQTMIAFECAYENIETILAGQCNVIRQPVRYCLYDYFIHILFHPYSIVIVIIVIVIAIIINFANNS